MPAKINFRWRIEVILIILQLYTKTLLIIPYITEMSLKPELIAIYRLEFYKKQKNWKLTTSRKEKKESQKCPVEKKEVRD